jgi:hypothetical protein
MAIPKIFRAMKRDDEGRPVVEPSAKGLGVRCNPAEGTIDIDLDSDGNVITNGKGMSVAPDWRSLPPSRIPKRLRGKSKDARGSSNTWCFRMGEGPFQAGPVVQGLMLRPDSPTHANVVPEAPCPSAQFQADLARTQDLWIIDED